MWQRKTIYGVLGIMTILVLALGGVVSRAKDWGLEVVFLDVGQGDSILIEQGDKQILIDGGPDGKKVMEGLGKYVPFWDREIEVVIATHPDADHITGLVDVLENYSVGEFIDNEVSSDSQIYKKLKELVDKKGVPKLEAKTGMKIKLGNGSEMKIIFPDGTQKKNNPKDTNSTSIVARLVYGQNSFLFTGDLPAKKESDFLDEGMDISADVLKVSHHGSKYASGLNFLEKVQPQEAVISVGKKNRYGHPSGEVLDRLSQVGAKILRTDREGDIEFFCADSKSVCTLTE